MKAIAVPKTVVEVETAAASMENGEVARGEVKSGDLLELLTLLVLVATIAATIGSRIANSNMPIGAIGRASSRHVRRTLRLN